MGEKLRRDVLKLGTAGVVAGLAGCTNVLGERSTDTDTPKESSRPTGAQTAVTTSAVARAELRSQIGDLETRLEGLRSKVETKNGTITSLESNLAEKKEQIETLEVELESLNAKLENKTARINELESSVEEKNKRVSELEEEVESARQSGSELSEAVRKEAQSVGKSIRDAVVVLRGEDGGSGTAWFHEAGYVITNSHVVGTQDSFSAWTLNGKKFSPELLGRSDYLTDPYHDVAVLETDITPPDTLSIGESSSLEKGQPVAQVGHPGMFGNWAIALGKYVKDGFGNRVLTTVPTMQGSSGSALVTFSGNVVGILTGEVKQETGGNSHPPEPVGTKVYEEYPTSTYSSYDKTPVINKYVRKYGN